MASAAPSRRVRRLSAAAAGALLCVALLVATGLVALTGTRIRGADDSVLHGLRSLDRAWTDAPLNGVAHLADPPVYLLVSALLVAIALVARRRPALAAAVGALLAGSAVMTQVLKHALATPRVVDWLGTDQINPQSWPSGHATAAMALALGAVLVARPGHRRWAALAGGALAGSVGIAVIALAWHFPSDVLGGFLVAGAWTLGALAVLEVIDPAPETTLAWADVRRAALLVTGGTLLVVLAAAAGWVLREAGAVGSLAAPARLTGALVIAVAAAALPLAMSRAIDRR